MKKSIEELYRKAKRFDEGDLYQSKEYSTIARNQREVYQKICALFGPAVVPLLEEYTAAVSDEIELECRHFFEQGYRMGCAEVRMIGR